MMTVRPRLLNTRDVAVFSAAEFGAAGDGARDDGAKLQDALEAAKEAGGGIVLLGPGTYNVSQNLGLSAASNVVLRGSGMGSTAIVDTRASSAEGPTGSFYGLVSFALSNRCGIEALTLRGPLVIGTLAGANTSDGSRKGTFFRDSHHCWVRGVECHGFVDEGIYGDVTGAGSPEWGAGWWAEGCYVHTNRSNGINFNTSGYVAGRGTFVRGNIIKNCYHSAILTGGGTVIVTDNDISGPDIQTGATIATIDANSRGIFANNLIHDIDCSSGGVSAVGFSGTWSAPSHIQCVNNVLRDVVGDFDEVNQGAAFGFGDCYSATILGNSVINCGRAPGTFGDGGIAFVIAGSNTAHVYMSDNTVRKQDRNITVGLEVRSGVPANAVHVGANDFRDCDTPYSLSVAVRSALQEAMALGLGV